MAFRAIHAEWGAVFAHLPDLGCGQAWETAWKVRPPAPLACDECRHPMHAKVSRNGLRFFAHAPGAPNWGAGKNHAMNTASVSTLLNTARRTG